MPVELPTFEDGYGLTCCVCGVTEATSVTLKQMKKRVAKYDTRQGEVFLRAWIETEPKESLYVNWARSVCFESEPPPKVTTGRIEDVLHIVESAYDLTVRATVCASFRVPIAELPERGIIRSLLLDTRSARVSIQMTGASFTLTGLPTSRLRWYIVNPKEDAKVVHVDLKGYEKFRVSETYLSEVWRWIYEQFTVFVLGRGRINPNSKTE